MRQRRAATGCDALGGGDGGTVRMIGELVAGATGAASVDPTAGLHLEVLQDPGSVMALEESIDDLCQDLCRANVFFEPWCLFPALKHLGRSERFQFLCLYESGGRQRLCGFLPLIESRLHPYLPLKAFEVWAHSQCFRCTPLVRKGFAERFWQLVLSWLDNRPWHSRLLHLQKLPADGELWRALQGALQARPSYRTLLYRYDTAFLRIGADHFETLRRAMSGNTRRKLEQQRNRLAKLGNLTFTDIDDGAPIEPVVEEFLQLEASGWKGEAGTALASNESDAAFFRDVVRAAYDRGRLCFLSLRLDGRMIAGQCALLTPPGAFQFKCAYDESLGRFSPGTQLEMEEVRRLHDPADPLRGGLSWCDSCAGPDDGPNYRCWPDRMPIARCRITTAWTPHALAIGLWPLVRRWLRRFVRS